MLDRPEKTGKELARELDKIDPESDLGKSILTAGDQAEALGKMFEYSKLHGRVQCNKHTQPGPNILFGCNHCEAGGQDPVNPCGLIMMPRNYVICVECLQLWQRGKFKFMTELRTHCRHCVEDECIRLQTIKPTLFNNLRDNPMANIIKRG